MDFTEDWNSSQKDVDDTILGPLATKKEPPPPLHPQDQNTDVLATENIRGLVWAGRHRKLLWEGNRIPTFLGQTKGNILYIFINS